MLGQSRQRSRLVRCGGPRIVTPAGIGRDTVSFLLICSSEVALHANVQGDRVLVLELV
jgi:hypothetical protein